LPKYFFYLLNNSLLLVEALLGSGGENTTRWTAKFPGDLLTLGFGGVLLDLLLLSLTDLLGPLGTLLLGGVSLGHVLALLFLQGGRKSGFKICLKIIFSLQKIELNLSEFEFGSVTLRQLHLARMQAAVFSVYLYLLIRISTDTYRAISNLSYNDTLGIRFVRLMPYSNGLECQNDNANVASFSLGFTWMVWQSTTSSSTLCSWYLVSHMLS